MPFCEGGLQGPIDGGIPITTNQHLLDKCGVSKTSLLNLQRRRHKTLEILRFGESLLHCTTNFYLEGLFQCYFK